MLRRLRRRLGPPLMVVLVSWALAGFLLGAASIPHSHAPGRPGLYNQEHDLGYLATFGGVGPVSETPAAVPLIVLVVLAIAAIPVPASAVVRRHADFRAPPLR